MPPQFEGNATFSWLATGQTYEIARNHPFFTGSFSGVLVFDDPKSPLQYASIRCPGYNDIGVQGGGYCIITDKDGDTITKQWSCKASAPLSGALAGCSGDSTIIAGTGKYAKISGSDHFQAEVLTPFSNGSTPGYSLFTNFKFSY